MLSNIRNQSLLLIDTLQKEVNNLKKNVKIWSWCFLKYLVITKGG